MKSIVVLYHSGCPDGFVAAWAAYKKFGVRASYIPIAHAGQPPKGLMGKTVYFLDIVYPQPVFNRIKKANKRVIVLDHHVSREMVTKSAHDYRYALHSSGAVLAWQYFFPGKKVPYLVKLIEEQDLWKFKSAKAQEILSYTDLALFDFKKWTKAVSDVENTAKRREYIKIGTVLLAYRNMLIEDVLRKANPVIFEGKKTLVVNSPLFDSELGNLIYARYKKPLGIVWFEGENRLKVSLRSQGKVDVRRIAEKYGGGGHVASAGFNLKRGTKLPWKYL